MRVELYSRTRKALCACVHLVVIIGALRGAIIIITMRRPHILESVIILLLFVPYNCFCQLPSYSLDTTPSSVAVNRNNGDVFITTDSQLMRLSRDLVLQENIAVSGVLVRIELSPDGSRLVGCLGGDTRTCLMYNTSDLTSGAIATVENAHYNPENGLAIITTDDSFYLGSEGAIAIQGGGPADIFLAQYNYTSELIRSTADTVRYEVDSIILCDISMEVLLGMTMCITL